MQPPSRSNPAGPPMMGRCRHLPPAFHPTRPRWKRNRTSVRASPEGMHKDPGPELLPPCLGASPTAKQPNIWTRRRDEHQEAARVSNRGTRLSMPDRMGNARASNAATLYNRATEVQPWKVDIRITGRDRNGMLQWGHGVSAVESAGGKATAISKVFQEGFERGLGLANDLRRGHRHARARVQGWRNLPKSLVRVGPGISRSPDRSNQS